MNYRLNSIALITAMLLGSSACGTDASNEDPAAGDSTSGMGTPMGASGQVLPTGHGTEHPPGTSAGGDGPFTSSATAWTTAPGGDISTSDGPIDDGPLLTTGNDLAMQWDVHVRYTLGDQDPVEGAYEATTLVDGILFEAVVAVPMGGGTSYAWLYGNVGEDGTTVTLVQAAIESFDVAIEGTMVIEEALLGGSGTLHDADTGDELGTWEILSAVPQ